MTRAELDKSLDLWTEREERFRRNWKSKKKGDPRRYYWFQQLRHAVAMVNKRRDDIAKLAPTGISDAGVTLIKGFEGFRSRPYKDAVGVWTIGYGETRGIGPGTIPWSEEKAAQALRRRINADFYPAVRRAEKAAQEADRTFHFTQNQADALTSFCYNLGTGIFGPTSTIGRRIRNGDSRSLIANAILMYDKAGSPPRSLPGLTRRRRAEHDLFLK